MSKDNSVSSVFTTDAPTSWALGSEWDEFLKDKQIASPLSIDQATTAGSKEPQLTCTKNEPWNLTFSTTANATRFKNAGSFVDDDKSVLVLGLDNAAVLETDLSTVLNAFTGGNLFDGFIGQVFQAIGQQTKVKLVPGDVRNAFWCIPGQKLGVSTALVFELPTTSGKLASVTEKLNSEYGVKISIDSIRFYCQRFTSGVKTIQPGTTAGTLVESYTIDSTYDITVQVTAGAFDFWLALQPGGLRVTITQHRMPNSPNFWTLLKNLGTSDTPSQEDGTPTASGFGDNVQVDLLSLTVAKNGKDRWFNLNVVAGWQAGGQTVLIGLTYDSLLKAFTGTLATRSYFMVDKRLPRYKVGSPLPSTSLIADVTTLPENWAVGDLFTEVSDLPENVPSLIAMAKVTYIKMGKDSQLSLSAGLVRFDSDNKTSDVPAPFTWDELMLTVTKSTSFSFSAFSSFTLNPRTADVLKYDPASLALALNYNGGRWQVEGYAENLNCGVLIGFFDPDVSDSVADIVGKLVITELDVLYTFEKKVASSFLMSGTIQFGKLELRMFYQYVGSNATNGQTAADRGRRKPGDPAPLPKTDKGTTWNFKCFLGAADGTTTTLGEIIESIVDGGADALPDFVKDIDIKPASGSESPLSIMATKTKTITAGVERTSAVFELKVQVAGVEFSFLQVSANGVPRRILRLSIDKIPIIDKIPLLNKLPQPFDEMQYMWVSDDGDLLQPDVDAINAVLNPQEALLYKKSTKPSTTAIAIRAGHHFIVVNEGEVALDHVFDISLSESSKSSTGVRTTSLAVSTIPNSPAPAPPPQGSGSDKTPAPNNTATKGALSKTLGPLTISAIALQYKDKVLWITMDAVLQLGPISLGLLGFSIGLPTTGLKLNDLSKVLSSIQWDLHGMALAFNQPPLLLAGMFEHEIIKTATGSTESYKGGVGIGFPPYTFVGVGEYSVVTSAAGSYKSVFIFAKLDGPLVQLEFATISGVRLGFGFNSMVISPTIEQLTSFPFINDHGIGGAGNNPMLMLEAMSPDWVVPKEDSYWFAAGMTITAFDVLAVTAVAMFAFRDSGVIISIFADAVVKLPPGPGIPQNELVLYVEIGLVAELNFVDGYFRVEASLAPTSFLLVPQCRLTGGFALVYWFGNNPHAGDWVFSIGGYHRAYKPPIHYPVPERVGISFTVGDNIQITGNGYFAITPKVAMGGAMIHTSLSVGPVDAYLDASFDALINFHPLHYMADFRVAIGVTFNADILFVHIHISVSIGADLHIEGPEFGGTAHVDFYLFAFDIHFGAPLSPPAAQNLLEFWQMTHQPGPGTSDRPSEDANPLKARLAYSMDPKVPGQVTSSDDAAFKFVLQDGNFPMPSQPTDQPKPGAPTPPPAEVASTGAGAKWFVKGGSFKFRVLTDFALSSISIASTDPKPALPVAPALFSRPMQLNNSHPIASKLTVTVKRVSDGKVVGGWDEVKFVTKPLPVALWGSYSPDTDPMRNGKRSPDLLNGSSGATMDLVTGVEMMHPPSLLAIAMIPKFKASGMARLGILDEGKEWLLPEHDKLQKVFMGKSTAPEDKNKALPQRWNEFKDTWKGAQRQDGLLDGKGNAKGFLGLASGVFGWESKRPQGEQGVGKGKLTGKFPAKLVDKLTDTYLGLPRIAVI